MKNLINYLSKKSLSLGNGSRLVRDRFEIGSAKSRKSIGSNLSRFCLASLICLCMLTVGVGNAWGDTKTWNLAQASYASANASTVTWSSSYVTMVVTRNGDGNTAVDNYLGGSNTNTRFYSGNKITFTPQSGYTVSSVSITCNTNYSSGFGSTWTNASQSTSNDVVTITPTNGENAFYCVISAQVRVTSVVVTYSSAAPATPYTVTFTKTDGSTEEIEEASVGAGVTPPSMPATCGDWEFQGWSLSESDDDESTDELTLVTLTTGKYYPSSDVTLYPVYTMEGTVKNDVNDVITHSINGQNSTNTTYTNFSNKTFTSDAVYAGNSSNGNNNTIKGAIQIRNSNNSCIISTASGGTLKKVTIAWNSGTADNRNVYIYGKNSAYSATTDMYDDAKMGTSLGYIRKGVSTELTVSDTYAYVGIKATGGTAYINTLTITWTVEEDVTYYYSYPDCSSASQVVTPTFSLSAGTYIGTQSVEISCATDGATIYYTTNGTDPTTSSSVYSSALSISSTTTLKAFAVKADLDDSEIASATYTIRPSKTYNLVTDASSLGIGDKIVILENGGTYAMSTTQNDNNRGASTDFVLSGSTVRVPDVGTVQPITLEAYADGYWYFNVGGDNYLAATGSSSALLKTQGKSTVTTNTTGKWSIALASSTFTVKTNNGPSYNTMRYNSSSTIFNCYSSATQTAVKVYVYSNTSPTIQTNPTSLSGFSATYGGSASDAQNVYVCGRNLTGNITVTPPTGYEVKKSSDGSYSSSAITLSPTNGKVSVTLNVRLAAGNNAGDYNGNLTLVGYNSEASTNVALTGNVAKITPVITFTLSESAAMANTAVSYTLSSTSDATPITFSYVRGGSSVSSMITNDPENKTISISEAGVYKIRVNQAADANHNAAAQVERELTITVRDVFKDLVNGYSDINGDDTGSGINTPTFAEMEDGAQNACHSTTRYLIGWIKAADLTTIYSGETGYLEEASAYESNKSKLVAPGAATTASGVTWYAVWGEEK